MQHLAAALDDPEMLAEAIRSAVEEVVLMPGDVGVSLRDDLMGILDIAADRKGQNRSQVITKNVAGPCNQNSSTKTIIYEGGAKAIFTHVSACRRHVGTD